MATAVSTQEPTKRQDFLLVSPNDIVVQEANRGRRFPPSDQDIINMAESILEHGQRQPIECRRATISGVKNTLVTTAGFTRTNAIRLIRAGFTNADGTFLQDEEAMVKVTIVDCNDQTAFEHNIVENAHRNETSDIDDAHNQNRLRDQYGYNDVEISKLYQYKSSVKVGRLRKLLQLSEEEQFLVHRGLLTTSGAIELLDLDPESRAKVIADIQNGNEDSKITGSAITEAIRNAILRDEETDGEGEGEGEAGPTVSNAVKNKGKARTMSNLRKYLSEVMDPDNESDPACVRFAKDLTKWMDGKCTDKTLDNGFQRILDATPTPVEETEESDETDGELQEAA